jgi:hypothetical protein
MIAAHGAGAVPAAKLSSTATRSAPAGARTKRCACRCLPPARIACAATACARRRRHSHRANSVQRLAVGARQRSASATSVSEYRRLPRRLRIAWYRGWGSTTANDPSSSRRICRASCVAYPFGFERRAQFISNFLCAAPTLIARAQSQYRRRVAGRRRRVCGAGGQQLILTRLSPPKIARRTMSDLGRWSDRMARRFARKAVEGVE